MASAANLPASALVGRGTKLTPRAVPDALAETRSSGPGDGRLATTVDSAYEAELRLMLTGGCEGKNRRLRGLDEGDSGWYGSR